MCSNGFNIWNWINKFFIKEFAFPTNRIEANKMNDKTEIRTLRVWITFIMLISISAYWITVNQMEIYVRKCIEPSCLQSSQSQYLGNILNKLNWMKLFATITYPMLDEDLRTARVKDLSCEL